MEQLTIYFAGLCTHLRSNASGVTQHRVVLINAGRDRLVNGRLVRAHTAQLVLEGSQPIPLNGVFIRVNAALPEILYDTSFEDCIPKLEQYASGELPRLSPYMIGGDNADLVSAYFDASGWFTAGVNARGAAIAKLTVPTAGRPEIILDPFGTEREEPKAISPVDNVISIENVDLGPQRRTDYDFLLHYKMFMRVPPDANWPHDLSRCKKLPGRLPGNGNTVGPGCSNSTYP